MTTASTARAVPFGSNRLLQRLGLVFALWTAWAATHAAQAFDFWLESALAMVFVGVLAGTYRKLALSDLSYLLLFGFLMLHVWGAQHKYASVPLGLWLQDVTGDSRNPYDRVVHFAYGLLCAYPMQEWFMRSAGVRDGFRYFLPVQFTLACSAVYELLEVLAASVLSPERGEEFVGMQGDLWDAQKDMFVAAVGAVVAMGVTAGLRSLQARRAGLGRVERGRSTYAGR
jgi:putative membrane protein